jgi:hypothetical protein
LLHLSQILAYFKKIKHQKSVFFTNLENISNPESGSAGESHPHAPTDPCVNLPIHMAPVSLPLEASRPQADAKRNPAPPSFLVEHRASVLSFLWELHLNFSLNIEAIRLRRIPHKSLTQSHATLTPDAAQTVNRLPLDFIYVIISIKL